MFGVWLSGDEYMDAEEPALVHSDLRALMHKADVRVGWKANRGRFYAVLDNTHDGWWPVGLQQQGEWEVAFRYVVGRAVNPNSGQAIRYYRVRQHRLHSRAA